MSLTEHGDLHQKKMSTWVTAVSRARLRRQPMPIRGRADSRQTTLSTVVTSSDGSSPFSLKQDMGCKHCSVSPTHSSRGGTGGTVSLLTQNSLAVLWPAVPHTGYLERRKL